SGKPSPTTADHDWEDLNGKIEGLMDAGPTGVGVESTVIDCTQSIPMILRPGGITKDQLEHVVGEVLTDSALMDQSNQPKSPGMKYKHYSPEVPLILVEGGTLTLQRYIDSAKRENKRVGVLASTRKIEQLTADEVINLGENMNEVSSHLYDGLRTFKRGQVDIIFCEAFDKKGIGVAVMNRLEKAATDYIKE